MGCRLGAGLPKALVPLKKSKTILDFQIERLVEAGIKKEEIIVIAGYKKELFTHQYSFLKFLYNENYARTQTGKSLLLGVNQLEEDILWLNGDVFFEKGLLGKLLEKKAMPVW